jgi:hypothetical protein
MEGFTHKVAEAVKSLSPKRTREDVVTVVYNVCSAPFQCIHLSSTWLDQANESFSEQQVRITETAGHTSFELDRNAWYHEEVGDEFLARYKHEGYVRWTMRLHEVAAHSPPGAWHLGPGNRILVVPVQQTGLIEFKWDTRPQHKAYSFKDDENQHRERANGSSRLVRSVVYTLHRAED